MVSNLIVLNASSYKNLFASGEGSLYVPVNPNAVVYAQFDHVHGIAASAGQEGIPISRVKILNTLIDQLVSMRSKTTISKDEVRSLSNKQMDALIKQYQQQIKNSIAEASQTGKYGFAGVMPEAGAVFSFKI